METAVCAANRNICVEPISVHHAQRLYSETYGHTYRMFPQDAIHPTEAYCFFLQKYAYHVLSATKFIGISYSFGIETVLEALLSITLAGRLAANFLKWVWR
jgi:hypothetical protein